MPSQLTDSFAELKIALENIRAFARNELTETEMQELDRCIQTLDRMLQRN